MTAVVVASVVVVVTTPPVTIITIPVVFPIIFIAAVFFIMTVADRMLIKFTPVLRILLAVTVMIFIGIPFIHGYLVNAV